MTCQTCGRDDGHYIGCTAEKPQVGGGVKGDNVTLGLAERARTHETECIKDGCPEPRAVSKGPRPAKYCEQHKTGSRK